MLRVRRVALIVVPLVLSACADSSESERSETGATHVVSPDEFMDEFAELSGLDLPDGLDITWRGRSDERDLAMGIAFRYPADEDVLVVVDAFNT